jgi:hypothetical protein
VLSKLTDPGPETLEIADQRLGRTSLTHRNIGGSHTPGNHTAETVPFLREGWTVHSGAQSGLNAFERKVRVRQSPAILTGRIFDDRGNRMSPTHSNKLGVRYRYYVSHAMLQNRKMHAGTVTRIPAPDIETVVLDWRFARYPDK